MAGRGPGDELKIVRFAAKEQIYSGVYDHDQLEVRGAGPFDPNDVTWLPPAVGTKAIGLALNYREHAAEMKIEAPKDPALFFKPLSALVGHRAPVVYPAGVEYMHYEVELVAVIGERCRRVKAERASEVIAGYTIGNDVTVRDFVLNFYRPPVRAKGYDTFGPLGPYIVTSDEILHPGHLGLRTFVNGELRQEGNTAQMERAVPELIEFITRIMTLEPGDMIWTGTPPGISHVYPGDVMRLEIDAIGALENSVVPEATEPAT
jgi:5-oxopent-3-ene-1,2,5-tricarboxylate decarboxylase/2-hydroxyhepta-2,4-diene-1,7-dioate isomerase